MVMLISKCAIRVSKNQDLLKKGSKWNTKYFRF